LKTADRDRQLYADYLDFVTNGDPRHVAIAKTALKWELSKSYVNKIISRAGQAKRAAAWEPVTAFTVLPKRERTLTEHERWQDTLATLKAGKRVIQVSHLSDIHFPDHNQDALNMAYRLVARRQPDIIVVGSDTADFSVISSFKPDPDNDEGIDDELDELRRYWIPHIETLKSLAPKAALVYILGNHEQRIYDHIADNAPKLRRTIERAWIEMVSCQGKVMWLGRTEEVEIGHLLVKHGDKANEHVAKSLLEAESYQVSVMAGHVHRLNTYYRMGRKYPVSGITGGCLCSLQPYYLKRQPSRRWQWGSAFATVDLSSTDVWFENVEFRRAGSKLVTISAGEVIEQPLVAGDAIARAA
jgi:hypothetical protein